MEDKNFPEYFSQLRSTDEKVKLQAAENIVTTLVSLDHAGNKRENSNTSEDLDYTLKKLIESAATSMVLDWQVGFTLPLAELLRRFDDLSASDFMESVISHCDPRKAIKKAETSRFILAKQLCFVSLIESGRLRDEKDATKTIIDHMISDFTAYEWAKEGCVKVILQLFEGVGTKSKEAFKWRLGLLLPRVKSLIKPQQKPEANLLLLCLQIDRHCTQLRIDRPWSKLIEGLFSKPKDLLQIALIDTAEGHPHRHSLLKELVIYQSVHCNVEELKAFWRGIESYLADTKTTVRTLYVLLHFLKKTLHHGSLDQERLMVVCQPHVISLLVRNLRASNKEMRAAATKAESYLCETVTRSSEKENGSTTSFYSELLLRLKATAGFPLSRFKTTKVLLLKLTAEEHQHFLTFLREKLSEQKVLGQWKFYLEEIVSVLVFLVDRLEEATIVEETKHILHLYLHPDFDVEAHVAAVARREDEDDQKEKDPAKIIEQLQEFVHEKLQHLVAAVSKRNSANFQERKGPIWKGLCADNRHFCSKILAKWIALLKDIEDKQENLLILRRVAKKSKEIQALIDERITAEVAVEERKGLTLRKLLAFNSFMLSLCFHHPKYANENKELLLELFPLFDDMATHYADGVAEPRKKVRKDGKGEAKPIVGASSPKFLTVLIELMISMLTRTESFLRDAIINLFSEFAEEIGDDVLGILVATITRPDKEYVREMSHEDASDEEDDENGDEEEPAAAD